MAYGMSLKKITSFKNDQLVCDRCKIAESFFDRLVGLIGTDCFSSGEGLLLRPCNSIHMWFMSMNIDVLFLKNLNATSREVLVVTSIQENVPAWRFFPLSDSLASVTLELPVGTIQRCELGPGDQICIS